MRTGLRMQVEVVKAVCLLGAKSRSGGLRYLTLIHTAASAQCSLHRLDALKNR